MRVRITIRDVVVAVVAAGATLGLVAYAQEKPAAIRNRPCSTGTHGRFGTRTSVSRARLSASPH